METLSFVIDGREGAAVRVLQYVTNGYLFLASSSVGMLWAMYVDYRVYHSLKRLHRQILPLGLPFWLIAVLVVVSFV